MTPDFARAGVEAILARPSMETIARHVWVSGRVQGVAFRYYTKMKARELRLAGWVKNLDDGRVEVWVEGGRRSVELMIDWLRRGPPAAQVASLVVDDTEISGAERFEVRGV